MTSSRMIGLVSVELVSKISETLPPFPRVDATSVVPARCLYRKHYPRVRSTENDALTSPTTSSFTYAFPTLLPLVLLYSVQALHLSLEHLMMARQV